MIKTNRSGDTFLIYKNRDYGDYDFPKDQELMPEIRCFLLNNPSGKVKISQIFYLAHVTNWSSTQKFLGKNLLARVFLCAKEGSDNYLVLMQLGAPKYFLVRAFFMSSITVLGSMKI